MEQDQDFYQEIGFKEEKPRKHFKKRLGIIVIIGIIILLIIVLIFGLKKDKPSENLKEETWNQQIVTDAAYAYYQTNSLLPTTPGECDSVSIKKLSEENLFSHQEILTTCDIDNSYVKVCMLPNKEYHYSVVTSCTNEKYTTNYGNYQKQMDENIPKNADISFQFLLQQKIEPDDLKNIKEEKIWKDQINYENGTYTITKEQTMYRYKDRMWKWYIEQNLYYPSNTQDSKRISAYYTTAPDKDYTNQAEAQTAYKWYVHAHQKSPNPSSLPEGNYKIKGEQADPIITYQLTKPSEAEYREIEQTTLYRIRQAIIPNEGDIVYLEWQKWTNTPCKNPVNAITCESKSGYKITDSTWYWYTPSVKTYYPSGSPNEEDENTYYVKSPVANALKDTNTKQIAYKWYKINKKTYDYATQPPVSGATKITSSMKWSNWSSYTTNIIAPSDTREIEQRILVTLKKNGNNLSNEITYKDLTAYVSKEQVIEAAKKIDKNINTLADIEKNNQLNLLIEVSYRNLQVKSHTESQG